MSVIMKSTSSSIIEKVDSHQHFWQLSRGDYNWLTSDFTCLYKDHLPELLAPALELYGITSTIVVQAADSIDETYFLLELAKKTDFIAGVVGWVDFQANDVISHLASLSKNPYFKGIRPMLQDIDDPDWILNDDFAAIFDFLANNSLTFDALILDIHLEQITSIAKRYPQLNIVVNHLAKPDLTKPMSTKWQHQLTCLAELENVSIKFSGLMTQAATDCVDVAIYRQYFQLIYQLFGPKRILWGSDWPVVNMNGSYALWHDISQALINELPKAEQQLIWSENARNFYKLL